MRSSRPTASSLFKVAYSECKPLSKFRHRLTLSHGPLCKLSCTGYLVLQAGSRDSCFWRNLKGSSVSLTHLCHCVAVVEMQTSRLAFFVEDTVRPLHSTCEQKVQGSYGLIWAYVASGGQDREVKTYRLVMRLGCHCFWSMISMSHGKT